MDMSYMHYACILYNIYVVRENFEKLQHNNISKNCLVNLGGLFEHICGR